MLHGSSDSPISLTAASLQSTENHTIQALDSFPRMPLSTALRFGQAVPGMLHFPPQQGSLGSHSLLLTGISKGGRCGFSWFLLFWGSEQVLQGVLGQQLLSPCLWGCSGLGDAGAGRINRSRDSVLVWGFPASSLHQLLPKILRED